MPPPEILDVTLPANALKIKKLLSLYEENTIFSKDIPYKLDKDQVIYLSHDLVLIIKPPETRKPHKQCENNSYYIVLGGEIGEGTWGSIIKVLGTWKLNDKNGIWFKTKTEGKKRLLKIAKTEQLLEYDLTKNYFQYQWLSPMAQQNYIEDFLENLFILFEKEQKNSSLTPHMSTKYPVIQRDQEIFFLMRAQIGEPLKLLISQIHANQNSITVLQKLVLILQLFHMLYAQAHCFRLVHRDVTPSNILVNRDPYGFFSPLLIDYGASELLIEEKTDYPFSGTPTYMEPHILEKKGIPLDIGQDHWALALIAAELFGFNTNVTSHAALIRRNKDTRFYGLFSNLLNFTNSQCELTRLVLTRMTRYDPKDRCSSEEAIGVFQHIYFKQCRSLHTPLKKLQSVLEDLKTQLPDYIKCDQDKKNILDKEFLAAEALVALYDHYASVAGIIIKQFINSRIKQSLPLSAIWKEFCELLIAEILPPDPPKALVSFLNNFNLNALYNNRSQFALIVQLSETFRRLSFINMDLPDLYNSAFSCDEKKINLAIVKNDIDKQIMSRLKQIFPYTECLGLIHYSYLTLFEQAIDNSSLALETFQEEFLAAQRLYLLYEDCKKFNHTIEAELALAKAFQPSLPFVETWRTVLELLQDTLYASLKNSQSYMLNFWKLWSNNERRKTNEIRSLLKIVEENLSDSVNPTSTVKASQENISPSGFFCPRVSRAPSQQSSILSHSTVRFSSEPN